MPVETQAGGPSPGEIADGATALGIVIAFGVLAASVGLIRSETARDLRTLTATWASTTTRRTTAAARGLLGAILGMAAAVIAGLAFTHGSLSATFGDVLSDGERQEERVPTRRYARVSLPATAAVRTAPNWRICAPVRVSVTGWLVYGHGAGGLAGRWRASCR